MRKTIFKDSNGDDIHFGDTLILEDIGLTGYKIDEPLFMEVVDCPEFNDVTRSILKMFHSVIKT